MLTGWSKASHSPSPLPELARMRTIALALTCIACAAPLAAQQLPDSAFHPPVARPAYKEGAGPTLCLDEAHHNFHTLDNRFFAFGALARRDGFQTRAAKVAFTAASLAPCRILVISNAQPSDAGWDDYPSPTPSAFSAAEIDAVKKWVSGGGSLLLIADHMPLAGAAKALAAAFDVDFIDGFALARFTPGKAGRDSAFAIPTLFRTNDGTLADHAIVRGRDASERVTQVRSFTGQAFRGALDPVMVLPPNFVVLEPAKAWRFDDATPVRDVGGWLQGGAKRVGRGRAAFFGEAAMFSAQVAGPARAPMGMNAPLAEQNAQFVLNVLGWLAGVLEP